MAQYQSTPDLSPEEQAIVDRFDAEFAKGTVIVARQKPLRSASKVNVYVDGLLVTMDEEMLQHLIDAGFFKVVARRP